MILPRDRWPPSWKGMRNPVCPLRLALYGHPDAGGFWEQHCEEHLVSVGFVPITDWRSCFWHPELRLFLVVYVDDFKLSGPAKALPLGWSRLRAGLEMEDPHPMNLFLGCHHRESVQTSPLSGRQVRVIEYDMEDFLRSCTALYTELTGETKFRSVATPFLEDEHEPLDPVSPADAKAAANGGAAPPLPNGRASTSALGGGPPAIEDELRGELADSAAHGAF